MRGRGALNHLGLREQCGLDTLSQTFFNPSAYVVRMQRSGLTTRSVVVARSKTPLLLLLMRFGVDSQCRINAILKFRSLRLKPS